MTKTARLKLRQFRLVEDWWGKYDSDLRILEKKLERKFKTKFNLQVSLLARSCPELPQEAPGCNHVWGMKKVHW